MRTSIADLVPILVLSGAFAPVQAQAMEASAAIQSAVAARLGIEAADVVVEGLSIGGPTDLDWKVELPRYGSLTGRVSLTLWATVDGHPVRHRVTPDLTAWLSVPVATATTRPGQPLSLSLARVASSTLGGETPVDPALTWEAATTLQAGQPVTTLRARPAPAMREGQDVTLVVTRGAVTVRAPGRLEADAFSGQPVAGPTLATKPLARGPFADGVVTLGGS